MIRTEFGPAENSTAATEVDSADYDATNEEEDPLNPADIEGHANDDDDPASEADPQSLPNNDFCFTEDDFLESVTGMNDATRHRGVWHNAWKKITELEGKEIECNNAKDGKVVWKVIKECDEDAFRYIREREIKMIVDKSFDPLIPQERESTDITGSETNTASTVSKKKPDDYNDVFWLLWAQHMENDREKLNTKIAEENVKNKLTYKRVIRLVTRAEYMFFHALLIASSGHIHQGEKLWKDNRGNHKKKRRGLSNDVDFGKYLKWWRFKQIKFFIPFVMEDTDMKDNDVDWWKFKKRVIEHNESKVRKISASHVLVFDESMSAFVPR